MSWKWKGPGPPGSENYELMGERIAIEFLQIAHKDEPASLFQRLPAFFRKS